MGTKFEMKMTCNEGVVLLNAYRGTLGSMAYCGTTERDLKVLRAFGYITRDVPPIMTVKGHKKVQSMLRVRI